MICSKTWISKRLTRFGVKGACNCIALMYSVNLWSLKGEVSRPYSIYRDLSAARKFCIWAEVMIFW